jgi:hypothetical protein
MSHRLENLEISKVTVAAAARFTFFYYRRGAVAIFHFPSRRGSGRCSAAMDISEILIRSTVF